MDDKENLKVVEAVERLARQVEGLCDDARSTRDGVTAKLPWILLALVLSGGGWFANQWASTVTSSLHDHDKLLAEVGRQFVSVESTMKEIDKRETNNRRDIDAHRAAHETDMRRQLDGAMTKQRR